MRKKVIILILTIAVATTVSGCGKKTEKPKEEGVYYYQHKIKEADPATFQKLNIYWAKDKTYVYNKGHIVDEADAETFEVINYEIGKDKNNVYWSGINFNGTYIVESADPETFEILNFDKAYYGYYAVLGNCYYAKDKDNIFYIGINTKDSQKIIDIDKDTFMIIDWKYYRDKDHIYYENSIVVGADPNFFQIINGSVKDYAIDNNYVYCDGKMLKNSDSSTFKILDSYNAKDKNNVYSNLIFGCTINDSNAGTYEVLNRNYRKDNNNVYFFQKIIKGANPESFEVIQDIYGIDKNNVYYMFDIIEKANPQTFIYLNHGYAKDNKNIFFRRNMIKDVNLDTFKTLKGDYAIDRYNIYFKGKIQINAKEPIEIKNNNLYKNLKGKIVLQVEGDGEAYYISPDKKQMFFLSKPVVAFEIIRKQGIGITDSNLDKIPVADNYCPEYNLSCDNPKNYNFDFANEQKGKIFLQVEKNGEAWYVNPTNGKRYFLGEPVDAFEVMRNLGLGISNSDFESIKK